MRRKRAEPGADRFVAQIAARQHGVASLAQPATAGLSTDAVYRRVRAGRLHRIHRGVYAVGHPALGVEGRWMAAVLAGGEGALLSHRAAAALWGLLRPAPGPVDITVAGSSGRRRRRGIRVHRSTSLAPGDHAVRRGIPLTTPDRTLSDLRRSAPAREWRRAAAQAQLLGLVSPEHGPEPTRSELERRFLRLCRRHRLPPPQVNARVGPFEVDFLWRAQRLVVEADGFRYHGTRAAFEEDRARDLRLKLLGYEVVRLTHRRLVEDPGAVAAGLRALLLSRQRRP